jgi:hypothetical protein
MLQGKRNPNLVSTVIQQYHLNISEYTNVGCSERTKEIKRRRHRKVKVGKLKRQYDAEDASGKQVVIEKLTRLTPGADDVLANWGVER